MRTRTCKHSGVHAAQSQKSVQKVYTQWEYVVVRGNCMHEKAYSLPTLTAIPAHDAVITRSASSSKPRGERRLSMLGVIAVTSSVVSDPPANRRPIARVVNPKADATAHSKRSKSGPVSICERERCSGLSWGVRYRTA